MNYFLKKFLASLLLVASVTHAQDLRGKEDTSPVSEDPTTQVVKERDALFFGGRCDRICLFGCSCDNYTCERSRPFAFFGRCQQKSGWRLSESNAACDETCGRSGGVCNDGPMNAITSESSVRFVAQLLGEDCLEEAPWASSEAPGMGSVSGLCYYRLTLGLGVVPSRCSSDRSFFRRFCCCSEDPAMCPTSWSS